MKIDNKSFDPPQFNSFIWAGFECTYALADNRKRLDMLSLTKHDELCFSDYQELKKYGITTVREGLSWSMIDQNGTYNFDRFESMMKAAKELGIQQIWDLNHFDFPNYLDPFSDAFIISYAEYAKRVIEVFRKYFLGTLYIVPLNEISFFSWIGGDVGYWAPYKKGIKNSVAFKKQLVKANIAAQNAIWEEDKDVRFIQVDPFMVRNVREPSTEAIRKFSNDFNNRVRYESWDMLYGSIYPELGGDKKYVDIIGVNYYFQNQQWILPSSKITKNKIIIDYEDIPLNSIERVRFDKILLEIYERYKRPLVVTETGSYQELRYPWWKKFLEEVEISLSENIPLFGVCAYPTLDVPPGTTFILPQSGIFDFKENASHERIPHKESLQLITSFMEKRRSKNSEGYVFS